jgi:hypothetical protein
LPGNANKLASHAPAIASSKTATHV